MKFSTTLLIGSLLLSACSTTDDLGVEEQADLKSSEDQKLAQLQPTDVDGDGNLTFTDEESGVSFDFPATWDYRIDQEGDHLRVDLNNEEPQDGCTPTSAQLTFTFPMSKTSTLSFEEFVRSPEFYNQGGSLGQLGGALTEMTIAGKQAFQAESSGYEAFRCEDDAYVVEMNDSEYLFIGVFTGTVGNEAEEIQKILDSLTF